MVTRVESFLILQKACQSCIWTIENFMCQVTLAQKKGQALRIASRCLWDAASDTCASDVYENESLICNCQVRHIDFRPVDLKVVNVCSVCLYQRFVSEQNAYNPEGVVTRHRCTECTMSESNASLATSGSINLALQNTTNMTGSAICNSLPRMGDHLIIHEAVTVRLHRNCESDF